MQYKILKMMLKMMLKMLKMKIIIMKHDEESEYKLMFNKEDNNNTSFF